MQCRLRFFASFRERLGLEERSVTLPEDLSTVADIRQWLAGAGEDWERVLGADQQVMVAVNQVLVTESEPVRDGDEVAFFPPVTGG